MILLLHVAAALLSALLIAAGLVLTTRGHGVCGTILPSIAILIEIRSLIWLLRKA